MYSSQFALSPRYRRSRDEKPKKIRQVAFVNFHAISCECRIRSRGVSRGARPNGFIRGRGGSHAITDARFKIIQKNREKLTDARDKLAEIAKQSDARIKLDKIRASQHKKLDTQLAGISRKTGRNGRLSLSTNKAPLMMPHALPPNVPNNYMPQVVVGYRPPPMSESHYLGDMNMDYNNGMSTTKRSRLYVCIFLLSQ